MTDHAKRALVVSDLLRMGWTAKAISAGLKVTDEGGAPADALAAMRKVQPSSRKVTA